MKTDQLHDDLATILDRHPNAGRDDLIPILQEVQDVCGYLSKEAVVVIGDHLALPASKNLWCGDILQSVPLSAAGKIPYYRYVAGNRLSM